MSSEAFVDTSILVRYLVQDIPDQAARAVHLFSLVASHEVRVFLSETVILETTYVLTKVYGVSRAVVSSLLAEVLELEELVLPNKSIVQATLRYWASQGPLSFADCYHLALTADLGLNEIYAFDKKMGRYPGVTRIEP